MLSNQTFDSEDKAQIGPDFSSPLTSLYIPGTPTMYIHVSELNQGDRR